MNRSLYSGLFYLALPFVFLRLLWRSLRLPEYRQRWGERLGYYKPAFAAGSEARTIVFHAVSVGEVHAGRSLIERLLEEYPDTRLVLTTSTPTGAARVRELFGDRVSHTYLPYDLPGPVRRFLNRVRPALLVLLETELWPNLIHRCQQRGIRVLLVNARLSPKSQRGYARFPSLAAGLMAGIDRVCAQAPADGERLLALGLDPGRLVVSGSMKFDQSPDLSLVDQGRRMKLQLAANRPVLIAASTRAGEEQKVLEAYRLIQQKCPELMLVLVPRHPDRFAEVARLCTASGFSTLLRSNYGQTPADDELQIVVGDSLGEMALYYGTADIAFVGGSLVDTGCQNILEPAALGLPVITGPSLFNFQTVSEQMLEAGAMKVVPDPAGLADVVLELITDQALYRQMSEAASRMVATNQGATDRIFRELSRYLPTA